VSSKLSRLNTRSGRDPEPEGERARATTEIDHLGPPDKGRAAPYLPSSPFLDISSRVGRARYDRRQSMRTSGISVPTDAISGTT
jgi:hypothetical protein